MLCRLLACALIAAPMPALADDTADFLKAENWKGLDSFWKVDSEKKTITGHTEKDPKFNTFLCSQQEYGDFELSCKVKLTGPTANSGIQVRSELVDKEKFVVAGPQCDMGVSGGKLYWGSLYGERVGGMMQEAPADKVKKAAKKDDWNDYAIAVKGEHITIKVNDETMVDADFKMLPDKKKALPKTGIIAFQLHQGQPMTAEFKEFTFAKK